MKPVFKYNLFKGISTFLTIGSPIIALCCTSDLFIHRSDTAISAAGIFTLLIAALFLKDKIAEKFKMPCPFIIAICVFILIIMVEKIILPIKIVCIVTMATSGVDELTFKRFYKQTELNLPEKASNFKHFGFIFTTTKTLTGGTN